MFRKLAIEHPALLAPLPLCLLTLHLAAWHYLLSTIGLAVGPLALGCLALCCLAIRCLAQARPIIIHNQYESNSSMLVKSSHLAHPLVQVWHCLCPSWAETVLRLVQLVDYPPVHCFIVSTSAEQLLYLI